jgi:ABC-2 type transport system ATP-binding protein
VRGAPQEVAASLQGLTKRFGETVAVNGLDLEVLRGECLGLLGPNGAGKSTTISMLAGILIPDGGVVELPGKASPRLRSTRRRIGIAPQSLALYPELTAVENLDFFGRVYGLSGSRLRERIDAGLELARLTESRDARVRTFSGGMARRLNLACAVVHEPDLLLADEPTVGVDPQSRNHLFDSIEALLASGMTVIYSTHYLEEVERLCRRAAIIDHGRILAMDTVSSLIEQHGGAARLRVQFVERPSAEVDLPELSPDLSLELATATPLQQLAQWSDAGFRFRSIDVREPNLESVFLRLTGRSLRD